MPTNSLQTECLTLSAMSDDMLQEAIVGDSPNFNPVQTFAAATVTLVRKPAGSTAVVAAGSITCDLSGYYTVTVSAGGFSRTITMVAFPAATLLAKSSTNPYAPNVARVPHLRGLIHDPRCTLANISAVLEVASPFVSSLIVGGGVFSWQQFGN